MKRLPTFLFLSLLLLPAAVSGAPAKEHPGRESIEKNGYEGPATCERCHPGTAKSFLQTVHWTHASKVSNVEGLKPGETHGMKNRAYTMCNGNDIVNDLKETAPNPEGKTKFTGCNTCHPGDHVNGISSVGREAEQAIDCLVCHAAKYDFRKRKPFKEPSGRIVMGQDRSREAALSVGRPGVKNCMECHESAGGGSLFKRGFLFTKEADVHAKKGMVCVDCHAAKGHRVPAGFDPNGWANDGVRISCADCHDGKVHKDEELNRHTARIACQTCHIPRTGGVIAKDFTRWTRGSDSFFEPTTLIRDANETTPVYAWHNGTIRNEPHFIGPKGSRKDPMSRIYPFKLFEGKAYFDERTGKILSMDFALPMATGDTLAGVASAAKTLGIRQYKPVPGWQTLYFGSSHLVTREKALNCNHCHARNGVLDFAALGYTVKEREKLSAAAIYFDKMAEKQKEEW